MKPTVISTASAPASTGSGSLQPGGNGVNIPINHEYKGQATAEYQQQPHTRAQHYVTDEPQMTSYGSPNSFGDIQRRQSHSMQRETPAHFQRDFHFEPNADVDTFSRSRLGRMAHDPFGDFGSTTHFGFPPFNSLGRRRINDCNDDDFFNRITSEFRQYMPESFTHRRSGSGMAGSSCISPTIGVPQQSQTNACNNIPKSSLRKVCDASIQTEDTTGCSEVDNSINTENLYQYGLRNTMDMGMKSPSENENQTTRSSSAPPAEKQQLNTFYIQPQQTSANETIRPRAKNQQQQVDTQTSQQSQSEGYSNQAYLPQRKRTPPPQTPGGSYIRTIPIFVEGRSEPIINNIEIPNENLTQNLSSDTGNSSGFTSPKQQTHRLKPLNTQKPPSNENSDPPPQTPHTVDTINKIQDIQRDVLNLMTRVEKFTGTRVDKEYVYLDEMLTRNLLKLDNIETNGKESIRLARREAIKCIQASINVLEAKAEENKKLKQVNAENKRKEVCEELSKNLASQVQGAEAENAKLLEKTTKELMSTRAVELNVEPTKDIIDGTIPLPLPENEKFNEVKIEDCPEDDVATTYIIEEPTSNSQTTQKNNAE